jgi:hypothetical protein
VATVLSQVEGERTVVGMVGVRRRNVHASPWLQQLEELSANALIIVYVLENLSADDGIELAASTHFIKVSVLESQALLGNASATVEHRATALNFLLLDADT